MKNDNFIIRRTKWARYFIYIPILIIFVLLDFFNDNRLFENMSTYNLFILASIEIFLLFSFFVNRIILTNESLIFEYFPWFRWRRKVFKIENIKAFYYQETSNFIEIEVHQYVKPKTTKFYLKGFDFDSFSSLYYRLYSHPSNRIDQGISK